MLEVCLCTLWFCCSHRGDAEVAGGQHALGDDVVQDVVSAVVSVAIATGGSALGCGSTAHYNHIYILAFLATEPRPQSRESRLLFTCYVADAAVGPDEIGVGVFTPQLHPVAVAVEILGDITRDSDAPYNAHS